jgi:hypothetical protein
MMNLPVRRSDMQQIIRDQDKLLRKVQPVGPVMTPTPPHSRGLTARWESAREWVPIISQIVRGAMLAPESSLDPKSDRPRIPYNGKPA